MRTGVLRQQKRGLGVAGVDWRHFGSDTLFRISLIYAENSGFS